MNKDTQTTLDKHIEFKRISVKHEPKLLDIKRTLGMFLDSTPHPLNKITEEDLVKFINSLTKKYAIRTINDIKTYLKVFIKWNFLDYSSRFRNLNKICSQQKPPRAFNPNQMLKETDVKKLVEGEKDLMWKCFWMVFFFGGFRPSEVARLTWKENVFFEKEGIIIKIHTTKTGKDFIKTFPSEVEQLLKQWREYNQSEYLFPSPINQGDCIRTRSICGRLKRLSKRTLGKDVVPYQMRHSFATLKYNDKSLKKAGLSDDDIARQLGHTKNMKNTYMNLDEEALKTNARMLWVKPKELNPDEKQEFEQMKEEIKNIKKYYQSLTELIPKLIRNPKLTKELIKKLNP